MKRKAFQALLAMCASLSAIVAACDGCRSGTNKDAGAPVAEVGLPTVRLYVLADLAGALEPCGCQKDMLGGFDHFASFVAKERDKAPKSAVVTVGPTFYMDETPKPDHLQQDDWKADAIASVLKGVGFAAFAPGKNDWAVSGDRLDKLREASGGALVAGNLTGKGSAGAVAYAIRDIGGTKVAFVGVSVPKTEKGAPSDVVIADATEALASAARRAKTEGARIVVGLAAIDPGDANRAAEKIPELDVLAIGSPATDGDANDEPKAPRFIGNTLIVRPSNHLTRVAVLDFHVRGDGRFADGSGLAHAQEVMDLTTQIAELEKKLKGWEADPKVPRTDVDAQKKRLGELRAQLDKAKAPPPTPSGSFVRYQLVDMKQELGKDASAAASMLGFYKKVNTHNQEKFKDKKAEPPPKGEPFFVGGETCKVCHAAPYAVWTKAKHFGAYKTLAEQSKEFNLDCVGCHVTGFEKPGGSTVTDLVTPDLKNVQCEACHGAGSKHVEDPVSFALESKPPETLCQSCHHPPHTDKFVYTDRLDKILGPGHGKPGDKPSNDPPKGWKPPKARFQP